MLADEREPLLDDPPAEPPLLPLDPAMPALDEWLAVFDFDEADVELDAVGRLLGGSPPLSSKLNDRDDFPLDPEEPALLGVDDAGSNGFTHAQILRFGGLFPHTDPHTLALLPSMIVSTRAT